MIFTSATARLALNSCFIAEPFELLLSSTTYDSRP